MSFFTNLIANLVSGFLPSVISAFKGFDSQGMTPDYGANHVAQDLGSMKDENLLSNYFRKATGSSLTDAEREANQWSRQQTLDAWERQMEADNTKYQRQVHDMQLAGINPMLAAGGSVSVPAASASGSVSPSAGLFNMDSLIQLFGLGAKLKNIEADTSLKNSEAAKNVSQTKGQDISNNFAEERERLTNEGLGISNSLSRARIKEIEKELDNIDSQISLRIEESKSEVEKRNLMSAQAVLARINAHQVAELLPFSKALASAQTESARQSAAFAAAQAAYQNGMLNSGMIEATVYKLISERKNISAQQKYTETRNAVANITKALAEGHDPENWNPDSPGGAIISVVYALLEMINPLSALAPK